MRLIVFRKYAIGSRKGIKTQGTVIDLLKILPTTRYGIDKGALQGIHWLNALLLSSKEDAGMSGGAEWEPFTISQEEYDEIYLDLATEPGSKFQI
jgi:hypothetical protein